MDGHYGHCTASTGRSSNQLNVKPRHDDLAACDMHGLCQRVVSVQQTHVALDYSRPCRRSNTSRCWQNVHTSRHAVSHVGGRHDIGQTTSYTLHRPTSHSPHTAVHTIHRHRQDDRQTHRYTNMTITHWRKMRCQHSLTITDPSMHRLLTATCQTSSSTKD